MTEIRSHVEYTRLHPHVTDTEIDEAVRVSVQQLLGGLCVPPYWVKKASRDTLKTPVTLNTVIGYPLGFQRTEAKLAEAELAFQDGAEAIELVINLSALKSQRMHWIKAEIARFAQLLHARNALLTVTAEMAALTDNEMEVIGKTSVDAGADFVKNATGFAETLDSIAHAERLLRLLTPHVGLKMQVRTPERSRVRQLLDLGVSVVCVPTLAFLSEQPLPSGNA